jgi:hypothetical protein
MIAVLEADDARVALGRHPDAVGEAALEVSCVNAALVGPIHDGERPTARANVPQQVVDGSVGARQVAERAEQISIEPGWHTFVMDNKQRSTEKLAGKQSLGVDGPTEIALSDGLEVTGPWYQSAPKDFSKPDLRWYSWGYEGEAQFTAKVRRAGASSAEIGIRGQACTDAVCKNIDVTIPLSVANDADSTSTVDLKTLIPVRAAN